MPGTIVLPAFVADSTLTVKGELAPFVADSTLTVKGELAPFVADAALDATTYLDLAAPVINNTTVARWLAPFQLGATQDSISATLPLLTASLTDGSLTGTLDAALPVLTSSIEAQAAGTLQASLPTLQVVFWFDNGQHIAATLPTLSFSSTGFTGAIGEIGATMYVAGASITGGVSEFAASLPVLEAYLSSSTNAPGTIGAALPLQSANITGVVTGSAEVAAILPRLIADSTGITGVLGEIDAQIVVLRPTLNALLGASASIDAALALMEADLSGFPQVSASIAIRFPTFTANITGFVTADQVAAYVVNTITSALTVYENFNYNSLVEIGGKYYGAGADGVFELVGDKDNTTINVDATISTGHLHFGSEMQKRMSDFYIAMRSDGNITLNVSVDERDPYEYTLSPYDIELLKQRRSLIGKGLKGKYWRFTLTNEDGCDFDFDSINAAAVILSRRL